MSSTDYDFYKSISEKIKSVRVKADLSQENLGARIGLTRAAVANMEGGRQQILIHILYRIAEACGIDPKNLLPSDEELESTKRKASSGLDEELKNKLPPDNAQRLIKKLKNLGG